MLEQKIYEIIAKEKLIENGDRLVLGVSGGPDSICMLTILYEIMKKNLIDFDMVVAHINHGLRENAKLDEEFVKDFCEKRQISCFVKYANIKEIASEEKRGLEETGRKIRYEFFDEILMKNYCNKIAIAHNNNDKSETILMNILRGTGIHGLIGMEKKNGKYIRPLLDIRREEIEEYLRKQGIEARHDESNNENIYTRNKIRNVVMPYLKKEFNPNLLQSFDRLSEIAKETEEYLQKQTETAYLEACLQEENVTKNIEENRKNHAEITLDLKKFNSYEKILQKRVILHAIQKIFGSTKGIEKIHIEDMIKLCNNNIGNKFLTPNKNLKIVTQKKQLKIIAIS